MEQLSPTSVKQLSCTDLILWHNHHKWSIYQIIEKLKDGVFAQALSERASHSPIFLPNAQWVGKLPPKPPSSDSQQERRIEILSLWQAETFPIQATGSSMGPFSPPGSMLQITPPSLKKINLGQVVVSARKHEWIAHRIYRIEKNTQDRIQLTTKGDAFSKPDKSFPIEQLLGQVASVEFRGKTWNPNTQLHRALATTHQKLSWLKAKIKAKWFDLS